jgi:hypothetical protein
MVLKLANAGRERGLGDAKAFGRASEVMFLGQGDQHFKLVDHFCLSHLDHSIGNLYHFARSRGTDAVSVPSR